MRCVRFTKYQKNWGKKDHYNFPESKNTNSPKPEDIQLTLIENQQHILTLEKQETVHVLQFSMKKLLEQLIDEQNC